MVADGMTEEEILRSYPDLEREDIREALQYAAEAVRERALPLLTAPWGSSSRMHCHPQLLVACARRAMMPFTSGTMGCKPRLGRH
jgi:hypothetical protein